MRDVSAFLDAVKRGDLPQVEQFLSDRSLVDAVTPEGVSALLLALYHGHPGVAKAIQSRRSRLTIFEAAALGDAEQVLAQLTRRRSLAQEHAPDGYSALGLAAYFGHLAVVELLLEHGADPNAPARNAMEVTPLHSAVANPSPGIAVALAGALLARGANPNVKQHGGWTPLHAAAAHGHRELATLLLSNGADPRPVSDAGKTPSQMASELGNVGLAEWLEGVGKEE